MQYTYNILNQVYEWILSKQKDIEIRLLNEKSNQIQIGDYITFNNKEKDGEYIKVKVIDKKIFNTVDNLLDTYDINRIMPKCSSLELIKTLDNIYGEEAKNRKLVAFIFKYIIRDEEI